MKTCQSDPFPPVNKEQVFVLTSFLKLSEKSHDDLIENTDIGIFYNKIVADLLFP